MESKPPQDLHGLDPGELLARGMHTIRPSGGLHDWTPPTPEELARLLPQYQIESLLGRGGMGAVYKGFQEKLGRSVAVKLLPAELTADEQFVTRFEREARTLAKLQHPGIVAVYDFGQTSDGHLYFVMEYVEGTDLRRLLKGPGFEPGQALEIIVQICESLQAAHRQGVVHRDIKPANILITADGHVKLADFGLARPDHEENDGLTLSNVVLGTPDYMAPEQHTGRPDHRADIFALGLMLYEMLTGKLPRGAWVPPSHKVQVDVRIDEVVKRALQEEPDLRYQQADEMKTDVNHIRSSVVEIQSPAPEVRRYSKALIVALIIGVLATAASGLFLLLTPENAVRQTVESTLAAKPETSAPPSSSPFDRPIAAASPSPVARPSSSEKNALVVTSATPVARQADPSPPHQSIDVNPPPASLEQALFEYRWDYKTIKSSNHFSRSLFFRDGGGVYSIGPTTQLLHSWVRTGERSLRVEFTTPMDIVFNKTFSSFTGTRTDGAAVEGQRTRLLDDSDRKMLAEVVSKLTVPTSRRARLAQLETTEAPVAMTAPFRKDDKESVPQSLGPGSLTPKSASQALVAFRWKFDSPREKGDLAFGSDGTISKTWKETFPWRWEPQDERTFLVREIGGNSAATILTFNEDFSIFAGPGLTENQTFRGERLP